MKLTKDKNCPVIWKSWKNSKEGRLDLRDRKHGEIDEQSYKYIVAEQHKKGGIRCPLGVSVLDAIEDKWGVWLNDCRFKTLSMKDPRNDDVQRYKDTEKLIKEADNAYYKLLEEWLTLMTGLKPNMPNLIASVYIDLSQGPVNATIAGKPGFRMGNSPKIYLEQLSYPPTQDKFTIKEDTDMKGTTAEEAKMIRYLTRGYYEWKRKIKKYQYPYANGLFQRVVTVCLEGLTPKLKKLAEKAILEWRAEITSEYARWANFSYDDPPFDVQYVVDPAKAFISFDDELEGYRCTTGMKTKLRDSKVYFVATKHEINISKIIEGTASDEMAFMVIAHEFGHALGLGHPGQYNGPEPHKYLFECDKAEGTIMSYNRRLLPEPFRLGRLDARAWLELHRERGIFQNWSDRGAHEEPATPPEVKTPEVKTERQAVIDEVLENGDNFESKGDKGTAMKWDRVYQALTGGSNHPMLLPEIQAWLQKAQALKWEPACTTLPKVIKVLTQDKAPVAPVAPEAPAKPTAGLSALATELEGISDKMRKLVYELYK